MKSVTEVHSALCGHLSGPSGDMEGERAEGLMVLAGTDGQRAVLWITRQVPRCRTGEVIFCDGIWHAGLSR